MDIKQRLRQHIDAPEVLDPPPRNWRVLCRDALAQMEQLEHALSTRIGEIQVAQKMRQFEQVVVTIDKLGDGSVAVRAVNQSTSRVLLDRAFVSEGGLDVVRIIVTQAGVGLELE